VRRPLWKICIALVVAVVALLAALLAGELLVRATDFLGVSYYGDVARYRLEAVQPVEGAERYLTDGAGGIEADVGPVGRIFENRPDVDLELGSFRYRTDSHGLRRGAAEPAYHPERSTGLRILFLGDSVTLGWGVDDEATWVRTLECEARAVDGRELHCLNAGHLYYDALQESRLLEAWGPRHRPEIVIVTFDFNDLQPTVDGLREEIGLAPPPTDGRTSLTGSPTWDPPPVLAWFPRLAEIARTLSQRRLYAGPERAELPPYRYHPRGWPRAEAALDHTRATCATLGARLIVFDETDPVIPELAAWCERSGTPRVGLAFTEAEKQLDIHNSWCDAHANALGNRLIADKALAGLRSLEILAP
jgi:hypothetical protein